MASAANECGGDSSCAADRDGASLLQPKAAKVHVYSSGKTCDLQRLHSAFNENEKVCGMKTVLADGDKCKPSCSEGWSAPDKEFSCVDGVLKHGDEVATAADLTCVQDSAAVSLLQVHVSSSDGTCKLPATTNNSNEKVCGTKTVLQDGDKCKPSCSEGWSATDKEFTCEAGKLMHGGAEATPEDLTCVKDA